MHDVPANAFEWRIVVGDEDIVALGHASNVAVVGWISEAAWRHSRHLGWGVEQYNAAGGVFVVRRHEVDYLAQARGGDTIRCLTWPSGLSKATAERRHVLLREADGAPVATAVNTWAFIDVETGRPKRIPPELRDTFDPGRFT